MEGKDVIIEKILSDARQEADKIVAEANDYATATLDKARQPTYRIWHYKNSCLSGNGYKTTE